MTLLALPESIDWDLLKHLLDNFAPKILDDESFDHLNPNRFAEPLQAWLKEQRADQDYGITVTLLAYAKFDFLADELDHMEKNLPQLSDELLLGYMPALLRQRFTSQSVLQHAIKLFRHETSRKNIASTLFKVRADLPEPASLDAETEKLYLEFNRERAQSISQIEDWEQERYLRPFVSRLDIDTLKKNLPLVENFQTREMIN